MRRLPRFLPLRATGLGRLACCGLSLGLGVGLALLLLAFAGGPASAAPAAPSATLHYPGCAPTIQGCLITATVGSMLVISAGTYITSLTLSTAVSLTGVNSATVILQALANQRVLTVTGAAVDNNVVISGLTFKGGRASGGSCPAGCGGGVLITGGAGPRLRDLIIAGNSAGGQGGGLYASGNLTLSNVLILSNTANGAGGGGGAYVNGDAIMNGGRIQNNQCTGASCSGGGLAAAGGLALTGTQFVSNTAQGSGGGAGAGAAVNLKGGLFQGNQCAEPACDGGGLFANNTLALSGTQFVSNTSASFGGGAVAFGAITLNGGLFQNNHCSQPICQGGGLWAGTLSLTGTLFVSNTAVGSGGGAYAGGAVVLGGGLFQNNQCTGTDCQGGGLYAGATLALTGTQFISNAAVTRGGGALVVGGAILNGGSFQDNQCTYTFCHGGGLYVTATLALTATQFLSNTALQEGGGVYANLAAALTGGQFQNNQCTGFNCLGGGLYTNDTLALTGTQFISNSATNYGGGASANLATKLTGGLFQNNQCTQAGCHGGGLYVNDTLTITGTQFVSNTASGSGGGAFTSFAAALSGGLFQNNRCTVTFCLGGGLYAGALTLTGTQFVSNSAGGGGGGAYAGVAAVVGGLFQNNHCMGTDCVGGGLYANGALALTDTQFLRNSAQGSGGGLAHTYSSGRLVNALFAGNTAGGAGAALYLSSPFSVTILHATIAGAGPGGSGSAIAIFSGTVGITNTIIASYTVGISVTAGIARESHNLFFGNGNNFLGTVTVGSGSLTADPRFARPAVDDYHLRPGSPAIDAGVDAGIAFDIDGDPRPLGNGFDIGYDEANIRDLFLPLVLR